MGLPAQDQTNKHKFKSGQLGLLASGRSTLACLSLVRPIPGAHNPYPPRPRVVSKTQLTWRATGNRTWPYPGKSGSLSFWRTVLGTPQCPCMPSDHAVKSCPVPPYQPEGPNCRGFIAMLRLPVTPAQPSCTTAPTQRRYSLKKPPQTESCPATCARPHLIRNVHHQIVTLVTVTVLQPRKKPVIGHTPPPYTEHRPLPTLLPHPRSEPGPDPKVHALFSLPHLSQRSSSTASQPRSQAPGLLCSHTNWQPHLLPYISKPL